MGISEERRAATDHSSLTRWKPLALDEANINHFWLGLAHLPVVLADVFGGSRQGFMQVLLESRNLFFEIGNGDGVVCFLNIIPKLSVTVYPIMFDKKLRGREQVFQDICACLFRLLKLERMTSFVSSDCETTIKFLLRSGFEVEGCMHNAIARPDGLVAQVFLGMLKPQEVS